LETDTKARQEEIREKQFLNAVAQVSLPHPQSLQQLHCRDKKEESLPSASFRASKSSGQLEC